MTDKPLILLDVDGVLNPFTRPGREWQPHKISNRAGTFNVLLNPASGGKLLALAEETGAELVWATMWEGEANAKIGPLVGLPELPVIEIDSGPDAPGVHPKIPPVAAWVGRRPFVWFDDDLDAADRAFLKRHPGVGDFLIVDVGPRSGLTDKHLRMAADWLAALAAPSSP